MEAIYIGRVQGQEEKYGIHHLDTERGIHHFDYGVPRERVIGYLEGATALSNKVWRIYSNIPDEVRIARNSEICFESVEGELEQIADAAGLKSTVRKSRVILTLI